MPITKEEKANAIATAEKKIETAVEVLCDQQARIFEQLGLLMGLLLSTELLAKARPHMQALAEIFIENEGGTPPTEEEWRKMEAEWDKEVASKRS